MMHAMEAKTPHIVVLGAGFGGLTFCQAFRHPRARVTLVDRQNHHLFQPLLYQVATAGLSAPEIAQPIRSILNDHPNVTVLLDSVVDLRPAEKRLVLAMQTLDYDYLVVAHGVEPAGSFAELTKRVFKPHFHRIDPTHARIILIEASPVVLSHLPEDLARQGQQQLEALGVEVRNNCKVKNISPGLVELDDGNSIECDN